MDDNTQPPPLPPPYSRPGAGATPPPLPGETRYTYGNTARSESKGDSLWSTFFSSCAVAGCATILAPAILVGGLVLAITYAASTSFDDSVFGSFGDFGESTSVANLLPRTLRAGGEGAGTIAVVTVQGAISGGGSTLEGDGTMKFVADQLRAAEEDEDVKAVILQIDSPGGGLTASDHLHHQVAALRKTGKPVIAWAGSMMASGGYYVAVAADQIMATPTATVGSIGVILQHFQVEELMKTLGIRVSPVTSGAHKDLASPFREMTPEERKLLQDYVDISHRRFVDIVAKGRGLPAEEVAALADGSIMGADAALEKGLIDSIGYIEDAVALVESELGERGMRIIGYSRMVSITEMLSGMGAEAAGSAVKALRETAAEDAAPKAMAVY